MRHILKLAAIALLATAASPALAASKSTTFRVTATVIKGCTVSAGDLALGSYDPSADSDHQPGTASTISVTCTRDTAVTVAPLTTANTFKMHSATSGHDLTYKLYQDNSYQATKDWSTNGAGKTAGSVLTAVTFDVYGSVTKNQDVGAASDYTDTVTVQITF